LHGPGQTGRQGHNSKPNKWTRHPGWRSDRFPTSFPAPLGLSMVGPCHGPEP
jgi:hypothetical protein